ncbi:tetratricopeptide repeat protein [Acidisoma silvae]|uniref:Tetratricopeptide repeat protein n=1 Tax=Acidisoma silvae TaxID=2802396 RepID=A0A964DX16_9PROT|nr:tetratricopeptide repeat protein [Acidisoma silvae]MCB8873614.1 tetratricopeptide repeat protein [Acidisoma silvae]
MEVETPQALVALGQSARETGDRLAALGYFRSAAEALPEDIWRKLDVADELLALDQVDEAKAVCEAVLALEPEQPQALIALGQGARRIGDRLAALAYFRYAADRLPQDIWRKLDVVDDLMALGEFAEAQAVCEAVLALEPGQPQALIALGQSARGLGDRQAALAHFQTVAGHLPQDIWRKRDVAIELMALDRLDDARQVYQEIVALDPGFDEAQIGIGQILRTQKGAGASLEFFLAVVAQDGAAIWPRLEAAADLRDLGRADEAEAHYAAVLESQPGTIMALIGAGYCARASGNKRKSLEFFEEAARCAPGESWPQLELAQEYREAGRFDEARAIARGLLERDPHDLNVARNLAQTERQAGNREAALAALGQAYPAHSASADLIMEMAQDEHRLGLHAECDAHLQQVLAMHPFHVDAVALLADRLIARNDIEEAKLLFERARAARPGEPSFTLGLLTVLGSLGRTDEAIDLIETLRLSQEVPLGFLVKLIMLLRQSGRYHEALETARAASEAHPDNFWIFYERFYTEILFGDDAAIEASLKGMRPAGRLEQSVLERCWGLYEENRNRLAAAITRYTHATEFDPTDPSPLKDLTRVKIMSSDFAGARVHLQAASKLDAYYNRLRRKSVNVSQTFFGQIINELTIDQTLAGAVGALQPLVPAGRASVLRLIARYNPDNTAAAFSLLLAMRQAGALDHRPSGEGGIPRTIAQFWDRAPVPDDVQKLMQSWSLLNPGYEIQVFDSRSAAAFLGKHFAAPVLHAFSRCREPAQKADIFRLAWLVASGGIYVDADDRCIKPLDEMLPKEARLVVYQEDIGTLANDVMAAVPRHSVMVRALELAVTAINRGDSEIAWLSTGPGLVTRAFVQVMVAEEADGLPAGALILDRRTLNQFVAIHCSAGYKVTTRHWLNSSFPSRAAVTETV